MMVRLSLSVVIAGLALTGCQATRNSGVPPQAAAAPTYTPVQASQPVIVTQPPPQTYVEPNNDVVPVYQPPSIQEPVVVSTPEPVPEPNVGTQIVQLPAPVVSTNTVPECGEGGAACKPLQAEAGQCGPVSLTAQEKIEEAKLDVLFVVDTSASLRGGRNKGDGGELAQIASQMENFVSNFPEKTDINIGVMPAHGTGAYVGTLFKTNSKDVAVLRTRDFKSRAELVKRLEAKMKALPNEKQGAQGEALLYSLFQSVNQSAKRNAIISEGFYRKDATLAIIMVTDEQDVCFDYASSTDPDTGKPFVPVGKKDRKGNPIPDPVEVKFFKNVCSTAYKGSLLTPGVVHQALLSLKGDPQKLVLMGIVYTSTKLTPPPGLEDENEMGHGVIDLVNFEQGKLVDFNSVQSGPTKFAAELKFLGDYTKSELAASGNVSCQPDINAVAVDMSTVKASLLDASGKTLAVFEPRCQSQACEAGHGGMRVEARVARGQATIQAFLEPKFLNGVLNANKAKDTQVVFTYMSRTDRDPKTGERVDPTTGLPVR